MVVSRAAESIGCSSCSSYTDICCVLYQFIAPKQPHSFASRVVREVPPFAIVAVECYLLKSRDFRVGWYGKLAIFSGKINQSILNNADDIPAVLPQQVCSNRIFVADF
jgi:hypothetical protein